MCPSWSVVTFLTISSLLHLLLPFADSNRSQHLVITEKDLKSSQIWKNGGVKLVLVKKGELDIYTKSIIMNVTILLDGDVIPDSYLHLLTEHFVGDNIPATLVEVHVYYVTMPTSPYTVARMRRWVLEPPPPFSLPGYLLPHTVHV